MGVRLHKVLSELNIGLQTAIDYLKMINLGEIKDDATVNTKISDEQYDALVKEFERDKDTLIKAFKFFPKRDEGDCVVPERDKRDWIKEGPQQFTPLGKMNIEDLGLVDNYVDKIDYDEALEELNWEEEESAYTYQWDLNATENDPTYRKNTTENEDEKETSPKCFDCIYRDKFLTSYKDSSVAYKKKNWSEWFIKGRGAIELFCKYYIFWICGEDTTKANNILKGYCDFEDDFPKDKRKEPQGRRLITLMFQGEDDRLRDFITDKKLYSAYVILSEFIHNNKTPNDINTSLVMRVLERIHDIYIWTQSNNNSVIKEKIRMNHSSIKFIVSRNEIYRINISDMKIEKAHEGDYMIVINNKHRYILDKSYTNYNEFSIEEILKHDWTVLRKKNKKIVFFDFDTKKVRKETEWGTQHIKKLENKYVNDIDNLYKKAIALEELMLLPPEINDFIKIYSYINGLVPIVKVTIDGKEWLVLRDEIKAEDANFLWGDDARIHFKGLNHEKEFVEKWFDIKIHSSKSDTIKKINTHDFNYLNLVTLSDGYHRVLLYKRY